MHLPFKFVVDRTVKGRIYPALSQWTARPYTQAWRQFGEHWPYTVPLRLEEYCCEHHYPLELYDFDNGYPSGCFYPIGLAFFDFAIDYFSLIPNRCLQALRAGQIQILFYYHEGDNPVRIKNRLDTLCHQHRLNLHCYRFVSANTTADFLPNFHTFHDFELWYHQRNINSKAQTWRPGPKPYDFLVLNRQHKSWRAAVMADLFGQGMLDHSIWSYCEQFDSGDCDQDNPIEIDSVPGLRDRVDFFAKKAVPKYADDISHEKKNDHSITPDWYQSCAVNIVIESQFDVDQSGGAFLTEKTFKPIKHAQMFVVVGGQHTLHSLRNLGYKVFDQLIDNRYDMIDNATQRWLYIRKTLQDLQTRSLLKLVHEAQKDILHNQSLFMNAPCLRLNNLAKKLCQPIE